MQKFKNLLIAFVFTSSMPFYAQNAVIDANLKSDLQTEIQYLSGTDKDNLVDWDFWISEGRKSGKWTTIGVPSCWEQQGFGAYNYGQDKEDNRAQEYGLYKYTFNAPKNWKNKNINIVFEGVMTDAEVKINGKLAGEIHQGAFYEFKYAITDLLKYGKQNILEVKVHKVSANESINHAERNADFWIFGGIYRPVYLEILPKENIERVAIDAKANGIINADIFTTSKKVHAIAATLSNVNGQVIENLKIDKSFKEEGRWHITTKANNVKTWNPEFPNLYVLHIKILDKQNKILHKISETIGFRTVEVLEGDGIYVNGKRIKFKGVNRHSFHPKSGRTTSKSWSLEQALQIKDMNMNAVRMAHYPPDKHFLQVCDSLGLFVINEICTWHNPTLDTKVARKIVKETVVRDVNHPSIVLWANGNEQGWNTEVDDDYAKWDIQKREVIHPWSIYKKTNTIHYSHYHSLINDAYSKDKILFPTEFLHGLYDGGHGAGLDDYWNIMWNLPLSAGGFLWDFADEGIERTDKNNEIDLDGNHAPDGIVGPYGEKEGSYFTIKEVWSPIYIEDRFIKEDFNGIFRIENRYHYTNLDKCTMTAKWIKFNGPKDNKNATILNTTKVDLPNLAPITKGQFTVDKPKNWKEADALYLTAVNQYGKEIFTWSYPVSIPKKANSSQIDVAEKGSISTKTENEFIKVEANGISYLFSEKTGLLQEVKKGNTTIPLKDGPIILNQKDKIKSITVNSSEEKVEILVVFEEGKWSPGWSTLKEYRSDIIKWTVNANGLLDVKVEFKGYRNLKGFRGITFSFPETQVAGMKWLGDGPYRVWRNRMKGTEFNVWENDYNNTITGHSGFVYPEFKGFFSNLYWAKIKGNNNNGFTVYCNSPQVYLRMLTPENAPDTRKGRLDPKFPKGDISFVMNIPAIGTKFQKPESTGPHGNPEHYFGNDDNPITIDLTFDFN
ncbi:beta-galactosidase [Polaribacter reichenbachii]|uniref:beta-galactosidase n=1 Tax=Polaribacter reichenbachii TaxID=996801 RepID=A0A1B8TUR8_9FLAO|nr:glycoside hydrolase family 2 TIM barrel-domain containing protein [Polaribacter reichenbachii]APZ45570.1 beta-galactosidase [Polaribacter reichenbachii]AUC19432.1 beta-galactosidase [Polaribacter reichenbachii]OBY63413.1 beta-galactosidase [Polaribacter reichenbachii]